VVARRLFTCLLAVGATFPAGCGGNDPEEPPAKPALKVPGGEPGSPGDRTTTDETTTEESTTTPAEPEPAPEPDPAPVPEPTPAPEADSPANDTPPEPGTAADRFEDFCDQNPGAC
jgi:hypothetical protein